MSTSTGFAKMEASAMPALACAGKISEVGAVAPSKGGVYLTVPIKIDAYDAGRAQTMYFTFRAEWFTEKFHKDVATAGSINKYFNANYSDQNYEKDGKEKNVATSFTFVYASNFRNEDGTAFLQNIFHDEEEFAKFAAAAFAADIDPIEPDCAVITKLLQEHLTDRKVGYFLRQKQIKTDAIDENGKAVYLKDKNYEIKNYFPITSEKLAGLAKSAAKAKTGGFKMTFDPDTVLG